MGVGHFLLGIAAGIWIAQTYEVPDMRVIAKEGLQKLQDWERDLKTKAPPKE
jgi:archaeosine-15-forming tRNA-guanine transglycosylase